METITAHIGKRRGRPPKPKPLAAVDFEIDHKRLIQNVAVPGLDESVVYDTRIQDSDGIARAWFNGSAEIINGARKLLYRVEAKPWFRLAQIAMCDLDADWQPIPSTNRLLPLRSAKGKIFAEDPRWIRFGETWLMAYTDSWNQALATFNEDWTIKESWFLRRPQEVGQPADKNWAFFNHGDNLYAVYKICPHVIINVNGAGTKFEFRNESHGMERQFWNYGTPRGGASPVLVGDLWWHWFHSSQPAGMNPWSKVKRYYAGVYLFENKPPFRIVARSQGPVFSASMTEEVEPDRPSAHRVVFPCGAIKDDLGWRITYGWNDYRLRMKNIPDSEINLKWL